MVSLQTFFEMPAELFGLPADQALLFGLLGIVLILLVWGRWRYDLIGFGALVAAVVLGLVDAKNAFDGFGHPATIIIALVLIVSKGLTNAGVVEYLGRMLSSADRGVPLHIALMSAIAAPLSAVMNNVAALALLMPVDLQAAEKAKRPPGMTLMALSFATILGGLVTLIGTPPNIVVASYRAETMGEPFGMFDFAPVGGIVALAGLIFVALIGWRFIPQTSSKASGRTSFVLHDYVAEARVDAESSAVGMTAISLDRKLSEFEVVLIAVVRHGVRHTIWTPGLEVAPDDILVIEAAAATIDKVMGEFSLEYLVPEKHEKEALKDLKLMEIVVPPGAWLEGRTPYSSGLLSAFQVSLVGVSRRGTRIRQRLRQLPIEAGDVLLLLLSEKQQNEILEWTGCWPLAARGLEVAKESKTVTATLVFAAAIAVATAGLVDLPIALGAAVVAFVGLGLVRAREVYSVVEWPVIVLLGSMIPLGAALDETGGTKLIAEGLLTLTQGSPAWVALLVLMVVTMTLSDILNNVATAVVAAPVGMAMAKALGVNPDPFLMGVAIASSCAFLTPIGHKNNILVLGPGGYRFGDYWRMGLPLEIIIIAVAVPLLLIVWPL